MIHGSGENKIDAIHFFTKYILSVIVVIVIVFCDSNARRREHIRFTTLTFAVKRRLFLILSSNKITRWQDTLNGMVSIDVILWMILFISFTGF